MVKWELMDEILAAGVEAHYQIKVILESFKDPFFYPVGKEEFERISAILQGTDALFLVFSTKDGRTIAAARSAIQVVHLLWDHSLPDLEITSRLEEMRMYFRGRPGFISSTIDRSRDLTNLLILLETGTFKDAGMKQTHLWFVDADGEEVFLNPDHLVLLEVPSGWEKGLS